MIQDGLRQPTLSDPRKVLFSNSGNQKIIQSGDGLYLMIIGLCSDLFNLDMDVDMDVLHQILLPLIRPNQQKDYLNTLLTMALLTTSNFVSCKHTSSPFHFFKEFLTLNL